VLWMYSTASFVLRWSLLILHSFTVDHGSGGVLFVAGATHWSWQWKCWNTVDQHPPFCLPKFNEQLFFVVVGSKQSGPFSCNLVACLEVVSVFWCLHGISHGSSSPDQRARRLFALLFKSWWRPKKWHCKTFSVLVSSHQCCFSFTIRLLA